MHKYFVLVTKPVIKDLVSEHLDLLYELPNQFNHIPSVVKVTHCSKVEADNNHRFHFEVVSDKDISDELKKREFDFFTSE